MLDTLRDRRNTIVNQIEDAQKRMADVKANLLQAEEELRIARQKVITIHADAQSMIDLKTLELKNMIRDRQQRLKDANVAIITFETNKVVTAMRQRMFQIALKQVKQYLNQRITPELHTKIIDHQLGVLKAMTK